MIIECVVLQVIFFYVLGTSAALIDIRCKFQKLSIPPPWKGFFLRTAPPPSLPPLCKFQSSFIHLLKFLGLWEPPTPQEFPIPSVEGVWIFSGTTHSRRTGRRGSCKQKKTLCEPPGEKDIFRSKKLLLITWLWNFFSLSLLFSLKQKLCQDANTVYVSDLIRPNFLSIISFLSDLTRRHLCLQQITVLPQEYFQVQVRKGKEETLTFLLHTYKGAVPRDVSTFLSL